MTYAELYGLHVYYQTQLEPGIAFLLKGRLQDFYKEYGLRIDTIGEKRTNFQRKWLVFDENNENPKRDEKGQVIMLMGLNLEDYKKAYKEFMSTDISDNGLLTVQKKWL